MRKAFFLTSGPPFPIAGARRIRDAQILSALSKKMPVEVLYISNDHELPTVQAMCTKIFGESVQVSCHELDSPSLGVQALNLIRPDFAQGYSQSIEHYLRSRAQPGDLVWHSRLRMAKYIGVARKLGCHTILDEHQVESDHMFDDAFNKVKYWHQGVNAARCALYEKKLCSDAEIVVTASNIDATRMQKLAPKSRIKVVPHAIRTSDYHSALLTNRHDPETPQLLFFGDLDYLPNSHSVMWFLMEILPRLRAATAGKLPKIVIASQTDRPEELKRNRPDIDFVRYDDNEGLMKLFAASTIVFFPLRYGRGNRINLLEAMAAGMPIVSTGKGADGLVLKPSYDICVAEEEDAFTSALLRALRDSSYRQLLSKHAVETARKLYDWKDTESAITQVLESVGI